MEGRILTIVVGWYSGYQEGRYVFLALVCGGCVFDGWCDFKVKLKVTIDYEKWEVLALYSEDENFNEITVFTRDLVASFLHICHIFKNILEMVY